MRHFKKRWNLLILLLVFTTILNACSIDDSTTGKSTNLNTNHSVEVEQSTSTQDTYTTDKNQTPNEPSSLFVHFLDVGQGNAILAESNGKYMLIDGGNRDYTSFVVSYLKKQGVKELDYIITSHYDADHLNGVVGALNALDVKTVLAPDYKGESNIYESYLKIMKKKGYQAIHPSPGDSYALGDASFSIVSPIHYNYDNANDNSIGIKLTLDNNSFLILGDAEKESEEDILRSKEDLTADVYLVSHHGSKTSSSKELLEAIDPTYAVISVGDNSYGHPTKETIDRVKSRKVKLFRTDVQGTIIAQSDGKKITWNIDPTTNWTDGLGSNPSNPDINYESDQSSQEEAYYIGNGKTHKFHTPFCSGLPDKKNQIILDNPQEAVQNGYDPCKICKP